VDLLPGLEGVAVEDYFAQENVQAIVIEALPVLVSVFGPRAVFSALRARLTLRSAWRLAATGGQLIPLRVRAVGELRHHGKRLAALVRSRKRD
jgi:hypothetical protein